MTGILVVDKPAGITSHDVVDRIRRIFRTRRVGHTGTLDPDATGVLVLCIGRATRLAEYLSSAAKHYEAEFVFGVRTDTMDGSGKVLAEQDGSGLSEQSIGILLPSFRGRIVQIPPMVSARHHQGKRLYELAREGITVEREGREVEISELELTEFLPGEHPRAEFEITCSTGTYIRVLAEDIGNASGFGAHMSRLRRTWVGIDAATAFTLAESHTLAGLERLAVEGQQGEALKPLIAGLRAMPHIRLDEYSLLRIRHGQSIPLSAVVDASGPALEGSPFVVVLDEESEVSALVECMAEIIRPLKVLDPV